MNSSHGNRHCTLKYSRVKFPGYFTRFSILILDLMCDVLMIQQ